MNKCHSNEIKYHSDQDQTSLDQKDTIYTPIELWIIGHLRILPPHHLSRLRDEAQLAHIDLDDRALGDHPQRGEERRRGILLHAEYIKAEGRLELWMRDMGLLKSQPRRPNESLELGRFACITISHEGNLRDHSLPVLLHPFARGDLPEHLVIGDRLHFGNWHCPLARLHTYMQRESMNAEKHQREWGGEVRPFLSVSASQCSIISSPL